jgi:hypothetical protein
MPFDRFYQHYPVHRARGEAEQVYWLLRAKGVSEARIWEGLVKYKQHLPNDRRYIPFPAKWLRDYRFDDEYDDPVPVVKEFWGDECARLHEGKCLNHWNHCWRMKEEAAS